MDWKYLKDKILVFGVDDYVFADMFISIISENEDNKIENLKIAIFKMLQELMNENLIDVFVLENKVYMNKTVVDNIFYKYETEQDIENFVRKVDREWALINYQLPRPNELFWITTNEKGKLLI